MTKKIEHKTEGTLTLTPGGTLWGKRIFDTKINGINFWGYEHAIKNMKMGFWPSSKKTAETLFNFPKTEGVDPAFSIQLDTTGYPENAYVSARRKRELMFEFETKPDIVAWISTGEWSNCDVTLQGHTSFDLPRQKRIQIWRQYFKNALLFTHEVQATKKVLRMSQLGTTRGEIKELFPKAHPFIKGGLDISDHKKVKQFIYALGGKDCPMSKPDDLTRAVTPKAKSNALSANRDV